MRAVLSVNQIPMKQKTEELLKKAQEIMGDESDFLIIAHKEGQCGAVAHGDSDTVAQAIFSCMHQPGDPIGQTLYRIIKLNVINMLRNQSIYAKDMLDSIDLIIPDNEQ